MFGLEQLFRELIYYLAVTSQRLLGEPKSKKKIPHTNNERTDVYLTHPLTTLTALQKP